MVKSIRFLILVLFCLSPFIPLAQSIPEYYLDEDTVYINDDKVFIAVTPHTTSGGYVYLNFTSKVYTGLIDLAFGFNSTTMTPRKADYYKPTLIKEESSFIVPLKFFNNPNYDYNFTFTSETSNYYYNGNLTLYTWHEKEQLWGIAFNEPYISIHKQSKEVTYEREYIKSWHSLTSNRFEWENIIYPYQDADKWYILTHNIIKNQEYYLRIWVDVIPTIDGEYNKYWVALKPHHENIKTAIKQNHFYVLDPWFNSSWLYCQKFTFNYASGAGSNYPVPLNFEFENGTSTGDTFYLNEKAQGDGDDIRFLADNNITIWDYYIEELTVDDGGELWLEVGDDLSSTNVTGYLYYGNENAESYSDGENTFDFFSDFSSNDGWTLQNGGVISGGALDCYNWGSWSGAYQTAPTINDYLYRFSFNTTATNNGWRAYAKTPQTYGDDKPQIVLRDYAYNPINNVKFETDAGNSGTITPTRDSSQHILTLYRSGDWYNMTWDDSNEVGLENSASESTLLGFSTEPYINQHVYIDWVFMGKYIDPSPNINTWSIEEEYSEPVEVETTLLEDLFYSQEVWGYIGVLSLFVAGVIVCAKSKYATVGFFPVYIIMAIDYLNLITSTGYYAFHFLIMLFGALGVPVIAWLSNKPT